MKSFPMALLRCSYVPLIMMCILLIYSCKTSQLSNYVKISPKESSTLYFITPTTFKSKTPKATFSPDFTIEYYSDSSSTAVMKFFLHTYLPITEIDSLRWSIANDTFLFTIRNFDKMFVEKVDRRNWQNRYTCEFPLIRLEKILSTPKHLQAQLYTPQQEYTFTSTKDWQKLHQYSFETLQLQWD